MGDQLQSSKSAQRLSPRRLKSQDGVWTAPRRSGQPARTTKVARAERPLDLPRKTTRIWEPVLSPLAATVMFWLMAPRPSAVRVASTLLLPRTSMDSLGLNPRAATLTEVPALPLGGVSCSDASAVVPEGAAD